MRLIDADLFEKEIKARAQGQATSLMLDMVELSVETIVETLDEQPTAYDVDKVVEQCENVAEKYADCDEFVCSKCGIYLEEWVEVSIDEDYDDEIHSEYVFKYCPNCGAKIKAGD
jgi:transcription initiation factor IIE alpha subunit|nr:MAG TPA: MqsA [Caudoviricetes sp.]